MLFGQGNAAFGSSGIFSDDMKKNGAAAALYSGALVVVCGHKQVIGLIIAPQHFVAGLKRKLNWLIIITVAICITPAVRSL